METQVQQREGQRSRNRQDKRTENLVANGLGWFSIGLGLAEIFAPRAVANFIGVSADRSNRNTLRFYGVRELAAGVGILSQSNTSAWLWARVGGDLLDLSSLGKAMTSSATERGRTAVVTAAVAGVTALDLYCAQQLSSDSQREEASPSEATEITSSIIIDRSPEEIYGFWRDFARLPEIFRPLETVQVSEGNRLRFKAHSPIGKSFVEWDADIIEDKPNSYLAWRCSSMMVPHTSSLALTRATGGRGTKVTLRVDFEGFAGKLSKLFGAIPEQQANIALRNLKQLLETGEVVNSDASIHSGMHPGRPPEQYQSGMKAAHAAAR